MRLSLKAKCTCETDNPELHYLNCDLFYVEGKSWPRKKKRLFFFYPMRKVKR